MNQVTLSVPGAPIAKKRPRFFRRGSFVGTYNCQDTEEGRFMLLCREQIGTNNPSLPIPSGVGIDLDCQFHMPIPGGWSKKKRLENVTDGIQHVKTPDVDNLVKFVKDCLNSLAWIDDCQVVSLSAEKRYSEVPRTVITIQW